LAFYNSALEVYDVPSATRRLTLATGIAPEWQAKGRDYDADIIAMWGGPARISEYPLDEPIVLSEVAGEVRFASRYYREWKQPQGLIDTVAVAFARDAAILGTVAFGRHVSAGPVVDEQLEVLRLLAPHFRRAVSISQLLDLQRLGIETFSVTLDALSSAVIFVDIQMRVVYANATAERTLRAQDLLATSRSVLRLTDETANARLTAAVAVAATQEAELGRRGIGVPARSLAGDPAVLHVLPLGRGGTRAGLVRQAVAALFIAPAQQSGAVPGDALAALYDLTPAETRIMELLADGCSTAEIGQRLGIAGATIKTHLLRLFAKTQCNRQLDLVNLVRSFRAPA
jgi:DNA-binding CsgD family transcriptional regulator